MTSINRGNIAIRFHHPGKETEPIYFNNKGICKWKSKPISVEDNIHSRKYLISTGEYISSLTGDKEFGEIGFWGEWEAESKVKKNNIDVNLSKVNPLPQFFHYPKRPSITPSQLDIHFENTDPCVFGDYFIYSNCQQASKTAKYLKELDVGDIIIFGSTFSPRDKKMFVIDTVFVIKKRIPYIPSNAKETLGKEVPDWYYHLTLDLIPDNELILYIGATFNDPVNEMYSFFPCVPVNLYPNGFNRPTIKSNKIKYLSQSGQTQGTGRIKGFDSATVWNELVNDILCQGLYLGVNAEI
ncbi:hypothetical protein [Lysinibacillus fusiformis]|uniref:hypothetical protein n=1 Tax=Lysinibacillus fusiformis TaxID=28031 RepID=UPI0012472152|nr:hypothetical protein [Lysinibacillus fusiformis]KAB0443979.1 hypothetical protein CH314_10280 [Lysinibacillus fusiformis]